MQFFLSEDEEVEVSAIPNSDDRSITKTRINEPVLPAVYDRSELVKEQTAIDTIDLGSRLGGKINGVPKETARSYAKGEGLDIEAKSRVLAKKYDIQDKSVALLMDTLNLMSPGDLETKDQIKLISTLSNVIDKASSKDGKNGPSVQLIIVAPGQRSEREYKTIDV